MEELTYFNANVLIYLNASQYSTAISIPLENVSTFIPSEIIRKSQAFWLFQGGIKLMQNTAEHLNIWENWHKMFNAK